MAKERLDAFMAQNGICESREKAQKLIMAGSVYVNGQKADKASQQVGQDCAVEVREGLPFVSRGGLKLQKAFEAFGLNVEGMTCADIGASTGGFTDCLLQHGAASVFAVDVGYGQLDWRLRQDERVTVMERTNARNMQPEWYGGELEFACMDVAFISIRLILAPLMDCLKEGARVVALIKPQFEAGRDKVGKKGVVRDTAVHVQVIEDMLAFVRQRGYSVLGLDHSPIKGPEGNIEFLLYIQKGGEAAWPQEQDAQRAKSVAELAHARLGAV